MTQALWFLSISYWK